MPSPPSTTVPRHNSVSSSADSSSTTSVSPTYSALATHHENGTVSGSPASSVASPIDPKFGSTDWSNSDYPHSRQTSLSGSLSGQTGSFRWPGSNLAASNVQPIAIPNSFPSLNQETHNTTPTPMVGMSASLLDEPVSAGPLLDVHSSWQTIQTLRTSRQSSRLTSSN
ncbi:hypothetical protein Pst134EA_026917 [Puccinia striiformis f. sp. tritici]|uniref:hypothetical protein n=1 Tax=Puccinia striiformis f. sp. tritici TaxID=168172 RepID=UPI0020085D00|nr:hypothetical protein Pst134EA_026917 [Puccinia striiformis f. sp. tritici]KAH9450209.1 hypothetical protein Pst134EA_026917 [Puccinia striiformis f. sp. tritici]